jgi:predicted nucleic acid-binding protein
MSAYSFDTSALVKRDVAEVGSAWGRNIMVRRLGHVMYASVMAQPEVISAPPRKVREGHLDYDRALMLSQRISTHFADS